MYHLDHYMPLREAVWRLGRAMFPDEWTGFEIEAKPSMEPANSVAKRKALRTEIEGIAEHIYQLNTTPTYELSGEFQAKHREALEAAQSKHQTLKEQQFVLDGWPPADPTHGQEAQRRCDVERRLIQAFREKELYLVVGTSRLVPWKSWIQLSDFKLSFEHSIAYTPKRDSNRSRQVASVVKAEFEDWLIGNYGDDALGIPASAENAAEQWMKKQIREWGQKPSPKRDSFLCEMQIAVPGLSERARKRVWSKMAPDRWKAKGPKGRG